MIEPNEDRIMVIRAVFDEQLPASSITEEEIEWLSQRIFEAIAEKHAPLPHYNYSLQ